MAGLAALGIALIAVVNLIRDILYGLAVGTGDRRGEAAAAGTKVDQDAALNRKEDR